MKLKTINQGKVTDRADDPSFQRRAAGTDISAVLHNDEILPNGAEDSVALCRDGILPTTQREVMPGGDGTNVRGLTETLEYDKE